ncbi:MAG: twitch domain-containing radical SAM protein [Bdellovibrionota bacterium]
MAPWTHTFLSPQSERRLCCASRESHSFTNQYLDLPGKSGGKYEPIPLKEHWNGEFIRSVRRKMLAGEKVPECEVCENKILSLSIYRNWFTHVMFRKYISQAFASTDDQGFTSMKPISFDYRLHNTCNFKCRMCGEQLSSAWEAEKKQHGEWGPEFDPWMDREIYSKIESFQREIAQKELEEALETGEVEEIYWVGGEPLVWDFHWKTMTELVQSGKSKNIFVRYNTNLSIIRWHQTDLFKDLLSHFKGYLVCASIDASGKIGEFIRTGLNWDRWLSNFKAALSYSGDNRSITMDITLTLPGLFGIEDLFNVATELGVRLDVKLIFAFDPHIVLSPLALPRAVLDEMIDKTIRNIEPKVTNQTRSLLVALQDLKRRKTFEEQYPDQYKDGFKRGREMQLRTAQRRGDGNHGRLTFEEIYSANKKVLDWWQRGL